MDQTTRIRSLLRTITGTDRPVFDFRLMEVVAVEGDRCRARLGELEIPGIRLAAIGGGSENGLLVIPAVGSIILVADLSCGALRELNAVGYSEIASIRFHQGGTTLEADGKVVTATVGGSRLRIEDGSVAFNDGNNGGLVKIEELRQSLESLKTYCQQLKAAVSVGIGGIGEVGTANGASGVTAFEGAMAGATIRIEHMENEKIKH